MLMVIFMKVIGKMIKHKDMEFICIKMVVVMKGTGIKIYIMGLDVRLGLMEASTKENMLMELNVVLEFIGGRMEANMKDNGKTIKWKDLGSLPGVMEDIMKGSGKKV